MPFFEYHVLLFSPDHNNSCYSCVITRSTTFVSKTIFVVINKKLRFAWNVYKKKRRGSLLARYTITTKHIS